MINNNKNRNMFIHTILQLISISSDVVNYSKHRLYL